MFPRLLFFYALLACFVSSALGTGRAGAYERIYFWQTYNLMFETFGKNQPYIMDQNDNTNGHRNRGSLKDGQLSFQEFMDNIDGKNLGQCKIDPPGKGHGNNKVAMELEGAGYEDIWNPLNVNSKYGNTKPSVGYSEFVQDCGAWIQKAKQQAGEPIPAKLQAKLENKPRQPLQGNCVYPAG